MKDVNLAVDGFKNKKTYYADTDSIYINDSDYELLKTKGLIGKNLYQSKEDCGKGGILYGLFLAPKIKYCLVFDQIGKISQKNDCQGI